MAFDSLNTMADDRQAESLSEFIAEARRAVLLDPQATIEGPDGSQMLLAKFLANWDLQHPERIDAVGQA